jgi:hypothetical protein
VFLTVGTLLTFNASVPQAPPQFSPGAGAVPAAAPTATAAPSAAPATTANQANVASQAAGAASVMCFMNGQKEYVTSIFDAPKQQSAIDKAQWDIAFENYVYTHFDKFPGNSGCEIYPSAARAQQVLQIWKSQMGAKLVETDWVYKGPEPGPHSLAGASNKPPNP